MPLSDLNVLQSSCENPVIKNEPLKLSKCWSFWYICRDPALKEFDYGGSLRHISTFSTVIEFWALYSHIKSLDELPVITDIHMFLEGYKPVWEDEKNINGGKWIIHIRKNLSRRFWENTIISLIGNCYEERLGICGTVISLRHWEDILSIWNTSSSNSYKIINARDEILKITGLPSETIVEYKPHKFSVEDNSSFRNTGLYPV